MVPGEYRLASGRGAGSISERNGRATAAVPANAATAPANAARQPRAFVGGPRNAAGADVPARPARMRSGVNGTSRNRTPVASKIALAIAAALGTEADSATPSGGGVWRRRIPT